MSFVVVLIFSTPLFLFIAAVAALNSRRRILATILGVLTGASVVALVLLMWLAYAVWHPTPHHFQDLDHIPDDAGVEGYAPQLLHIPVDHVYYYSTRMLRSSQFFRCHILHKADFEKYRQMFRSGAQPKWLEREKDGLLKWQFGERAEEYKTIKSWWDWPNRPDCEIVCVGPSFINVFDEASSTVYVARGDN
jgi:hypothetical protein